MQSFIVGVDEVGRGCLAGPLLVVAARQKAVLPKGVADSKLLDRAERQKLFKILPKCCDFGEGWVRPVEINQRGLTGAMKLGVARALKNLGARPNDKIIMDGPVNYMPKIYKIFECLIDADDLVPLVSAASIHAKVRRDNFMIKLAKKHPRYGFDSHVGYATPSHIEMLNKYGSLKRVHRQFFGSVYELNQMKLWSL
jgi:ribonuclease HII